MLRRAYLPLLLSLVPLSMAACRERSRATAHLELKDGKGRVVRLGATARRIAALSPSSLEILAALGCAEHVVLRGRRADYPARFKQLPATDGLQLAVEHIAGFTPDLVILANGAPRGIVALTALHIPVAVFEPTRVEHVYRDIDGIGRLCGAPAARRRALIEGLRRRVDAVAARVAKGRRPRVYVEIDGADPLKPWTIGQGSFLADLVAQAGGQNIFARLSRAYLQVNAEEVLAAKPDVIVLAGGAAQGAAALRARPGWSALAAVTSGRIIDTIDPDLLSRPGPRLAAGIEALAAALHPRRARSSVSP